MNIPSTFASSKAKEDFTSVSKAGFVGFLIQVLMLYLVTRNLLVTTFMVSYYVPLYGTILFRFAALILLTILVLSSGPLSTRPWHRLTPWAWLIIGSHILFLLIEGFLVLGLGKYQNNILKILFDSGLTISSLSLTFLYASSKFQPRAALRFMLQPYCYLAVYMAAAGVLSLILIELGVTSPETWHLPSGMLKKDAVHVGGHLYSFPFFTGLVLYRGRRDFWGFEFSEISAFFQEPSIAAFFIAPALFLLPFVLTSNRYKAKLRFCYIAILLFLFFAHSVSGLGVLAVVTGLLLFRVVLHPYASHIRLRAFIAMLALIGISWLTFDAPGTIASKWDTGAGLSYTFADSVGYIWSESLLGNGLFELRWIRADTGTRSLIFQGIEALSGQPRALLSTIGQFLHVFIVLVVGIRLLFSNRIFWLAGGAAVYLTCHSFETYATFTTTGFYFYILFIVAVVMSTHQDALARAGPSQLGPNREPDTRQA